MAGAANRRAAVSRLDGRPAAEIHLQWPVARRVGPFRLSLSGLSQRRADPAEPESGHDSQCESLSESDEPLQEHQGPDGLRHIRRAGYLLPAWHGVQGCAAGGVVPEVAGASAHAARGVWRQGASDRDRRGELPHPYGSDELGGIESGVCREWHLSAAAGVLGRMSAAPVLSIGSRDRRRRMFGDAQSILRRDADSYGLRGGKRRRDCVESVRGCRAYCGWRGQQAGIQCGDGPRFRRHSLPERCGGRHEARRRRRDCDVAGLGSNRDRKFFWISVHPAGRDAGFYREGGIMRNKGRRPKAYSTNRVIVFIAALGFVGGIAQASTVSVGALSYDTFIPAGGGSPGADAFNLANLTGAFSLPTDFPVTDSLTFGSAVLTLTLSDLSQDVIALGDIGPGFLLDGSGNPIVQVPGDDVFDSAEFTVTLSPLTFALFDGT